MSNKAFTSFCCVLLGMIAVSAWLLSDASSASEPSRMNSQTNPQTVVHQGREIAPSLPCCTGKNAPNGWLRTVFSGTGAFDNLGG